MPKIGVRRLLIVKGAVLMGFIAFYVVPPEFKDLTAMSTNCLWLFWGDSA